jgi:hypothetical protein
MTTSILVQLNIQVSWAVNELHFELRTEHFLKLLDITVETGYTAGIWGHHEHPRYKLTVL